jgi:uncharacterized membrane protein
MSDPADVAENDTMKPARLEAFTDGVVAIIITIMVLELKVPAGHDLAALRDAAPVFAAYVLSYVNVGLYWNNHHHLLHTAERVNGGVLWANLALLFWLSLVPFVIRWMGEGGLTALPVAAYGVVLLMAGVSYVVLQGMIVACNGPQSRLRQALGRDRKGKLSIVLYGVAIPLAFVLPWLSVLCYVLVAALWLVPDRRIERRS